MAGYAGARGLPLTTGWEDRMSVDDETGADAPAPPQPAARIRGLRKTYGDVVALQGLDLDVVPGSVVGLIGPNGAGKTTAVRCIAGLLKPDAGEVSIAPSTTPGKSPVAIAAQEIELYPGLSVETNLIFFSRLSGVGNVEEVLAELTAELALESLLGKLPKDLSIGQQRLVHVAAALVAMPDLLILDEPTAALDVGARGMLLDAVARRRSEGVAVLLSSHQLQEVETACDSIVMINHGAVIAVGDVDDLIAKHGGGRIEMTVDGEQRVVDGDDVAAAIAQVTAGGGRLEAVNVVKPSLETVFMSLTGMRSTDVEAS
ncbi:ABC transporter ATP-binding protein [Nonomuraea sp. NPDC050536]|uniref:ABC transporter ATP-binding protein n=1 Tax=Nonomuraea sp. NPDC050536 TaxID=3364366 RepID=UPI0037CAE42C